MARPRRACSPHPGSPTGSSMSMIRSGRAWPRRAPRPASPSPRAPRRRRRAASGRMEMFGERGRTPLAIVDYAHTPDALANALRAARLHCRGQLRVVFGCGGERDAGKRPLMGKVAAELADDLIVTDDNPRSEDPARIVADIVAGVPPRAPLVIEHDRSLAIRMALQRSGPEDVVLIAGKGHEEYQIHGGARR